MFVYLSTFSSMSMINFQKQKYSYIPSFIIHYRNILLIITISCLFIFTGTKKEENETSPEDGSVGTCGLYTQYRT